MYNICTLYIIYFSLEEENYSVCVLMCVVCVVCVHTQAHTPHTPHKHTHSLEKENDGGHSSLEHDNEGTPL